MATEQITIAGRTFNVPSPFAEGHVLTANESSVLNQTFHENIRNNTAKKLKDVTDQEQAQAIVDDYAESYQFGVRSGGGGFRGDPVMTEAMSIARDAVRRGLQKAGYALTGEKKVPATKVTELAKQALAKNPQWMDMAKERVAQAKEIVAGLDLGAAA